jgi:hypothetical protein
LRKRLNTGENIAVIERAGKIGSTLRRGAVEVFRRSHVAAAAGFNLIRSKQSCLNVWLGSVEMCPKMGLGSFGVTRNFGAAGLQREDREFGERLSMWENIMVIGIIGGSTNLEQSRWFPSGQGRRERPVNLPISLSLTRPRNFGQRLR